MVLQKENAVKGNRELMGATNPKDAEEGTIRKKYGISIDKNSVHGSDSVENAKIEIDFFFNDYFICHLELANFKRISKVCFLSIYIFYNIRWRSLSYNLTIAQYHCCINYLEKRSCYVITYTNCYFVFLL